jgi:hypothetical protein
LREAIFFIEICNAKGWRLHPFSPLTLEEAIAMPKIAVPDPAEAGCSSIEERIGCILNTPEIELDGEAYIGKYILNDENSIKKFINKNLRLDINGKNKIYTTSDNKKLFKPNFKEHKKLI